VTRERVRDVDPDPDGLQLLRAAVRRSFVGWDLSELQLAPLAGGITNRNYTFDHDGVTYVVRQPGERTELLGIDRANEAEAARRATELGLGPPVAAKLDGVGTLITEMVSGHHLGGADFVDRLDEVVELIKRFHRSGSLAGSFPIHRVVEWHARDAVANGVSLPPTWELLHEVSEQIEAAFAATPDAAVPSHNDMLPGNVLFAADRTWLLDYEYAGMNDRHFDLGNLSVNTGLDAEADDELLRCYFGVVSSRSHARLQLMKIMSEFREGMWAVVQQAISTLDTDFVSYADERLNNCVHLATGHHVEDLLAAAAEPATP
jgi:thiamine kinase-like enzyme